MAVEIKRAAVRGVRLLVYKMVNGAENPGKSREIDSEYHVTHNFDIAKTRDGADTEDIFYLGREGAKQISFRDGQWRRETLSGVQGGGEIGLVETLPVLRFWRLSNRFTAQTWFSTRQKCQLKLGRYLTLSGLSSIQS